PIQKDKTFFFLDAEQKWQRRAITFEGLVPSTAMQNGDFSSDPFGTPQPTGTIGCYPNCVIANPYMAGASINASTFPNIYFQCDGAGDPLPASPNGFQGAGTPCNKIPTGVNGLASPIGQALINLYPAPNANAGNTAAGFNFLNEPVRILNESKFDVRLDHNFSNADAGFGRFSYDQAYSYVPGGGGIGSFAEGSAFGSNQQMINHARQVAIGETHAFSTTTVNQASFGYNRIFDYITSQGTGTCASNRLVAGGIPGANLGCPNDATTCTSGAYSCGLVSVLMFGGYWSLGDRGYTPFQGGTNIFSFNNTLDLIRGKHDIKVGLGFRANQMNVGAEAFQDGFWIPGVAGNFSGSGAAGIGGNPEADVLLGLLGLSEHDQTFNGPVTGRRWKIYRPFVQDDWRVTKDLTVNLGLAWDMTTPISEEHNRMADFIPTTGQLLVAKQNGVSSGAGVNMDWTGYEPRISLA